MIHKAISPVACALGMLLIILSLVWPSAADKNDIWTAEQQQERRAAIRDAHRLSYSPQGGSDHDHDHAVHAEGGSGNKSFEEAKARVARSNAAFQQAYDGYHRTISLLKWSGIFLVAVGAIVHFVKRNTED